MAEVLCFGTEVAMLSMQGVRPRAAIGLGAFALAILMSFAQAFANENVRPWRSKSNALVVDAYAFTEFDWEKLVSNKQLVGFISKASDGRITSADCWRGAKAKRKLCLAKWRRYVATRELYRTRRLLAKKLGLKWGSYHLARPGDPILQAQHYLRYADPKPDELMALDIEDNDPEKWMSLADAERFARFIYRKKRRYPVLYTNHSTAKAIARQRAKYPTLAKLNLWYARYKEDIRGAFPMGRWRSYAIWQFQAKTNCRRRCAVRLKGTDKWMDVNVVAMTPDALRKAWPLSEPLNILPEQPTRVAAARPDTRLASAQNTGKAAAASGFAKTTVPTLDPRDPLVRILKRSDAVGLVFRRESRDR